MSTSPKRKLSAQEYLELERASETKSEFLRGEMFAMSGASRKHIVIAGNVGRWIHQQFDGRPCEVYQSDMRVKVSASGLYTYPDVVAVCHEPQFEDAEVDTLLNPQVIIEVLSKSTESYDRGTKFEHFKRIDSVECYIMIRQNKPVILRYVRHSDDQWLHKTFSGLDDELEIDSINCKLKLSDIYARVEFEGSDPGDYLSIREAKEPTGYIAPRPGPPIPVAQ